MKNYFSYVMRVHKITLILCCLFLQPYLFSAIIVGIDAPASVTKFLQKIAEQIKKRVEESSQEDDNHFEFDTSIEYGHHITVNYVSPKVQPVDEYLESLEGKKEEVLCGLQEIAQENSEIDISENLVNGKFDYWKGLFEKAGRKNYYNVVLKFESLALSELAAQIGRLLEAKQRSPFSAHFLLGRIFEKDDKPLDQLIEKLKKDSVLAPEIAENREKISLKISEFKLKGDEKSEIVFALQSNK